jgi:hypothetical protein
MTECKQDFEKCIQSGKRDRWVCDWIWQQCRIQPLVKLSYSKHECEEHMFALRRDLLAKAADRAEEERAVNIAHEGLDQCRKSWFPSGPDAAALYPYPVASEK